MSTVFSVVFFFAAFRMIDADVLSWLHPPHELMNAKDTTIVFNVSFYCNMGWIRDYCVWVRYLEDDSLSDDVVMTLPRACTQKRYLSHTVEVTFTGGDGLHDNNYEPMLQIVHNCTTDYAVLIKRHYTERVPIGMKRNLTYQSVSMDLGDRGDYFDFWERKDSTMPFYIYAWSVDVPSPFTQQEIDQYWTASDSKYPTNSSSILRAPFF